MEIGNSKLDNNNNNKTAIINERIPLQIQIEDFLEIDLFGGCPKLV